VPTIRLDPSDLPVSIRSAESASSAAALWSAPANVHLHARTRSHRSHLHERRGFGDGLLKFRAQLPQGPASRSSWTGILSAHEPRLSSRSVKRLGSFLEGTPGGVAAPPDGGVPFPCHDPSTAIVVARCCWGEARGIRARLRIDHHGARPGEDECERPDPSAARARASGRVMLNSSPCSSLRAGAASSRERVACVP
jgi:hypothetical protein